MQIKRQYGWKRDTRPEPHLFAAPPPPDIALPPSVSLRLKFPAPYDQGQQSACTGYATAGVLHYDRLKEGKSDSMPSPDFLYYNGREKEGGTDVDGGAAIQDVLEQALALGYCFEKTWPSALGSVLKKPSSMAYLEAKQNLPKGRVRVPQTAASVKHALMNGSPMVGGLYLYSSFESERVAKTGVVHVPEPDEHFIGGHAIDVVGYDDSKQAWEVRNSWGAAWGDKGYFWLDYAYLLDPKLAADLTILAYA